MAKQENGGRVPTRRSILVHLCGGQLTAIELAGLLGISATAVRTHLDGLANEGLVRHSVERRGVGKPTHVYELTPSALTSLSQAYVPVLAAVLDGLVAREGRDGLEALLAEVGRALAEGTAAARGTLGDRAETAATALERLGGVVDVVPVESGYSLQGRCCPLGSLSPRYPALCLMIESMLREMTGAEVRESCDRGHPPRCRFEVG